MVCTVQAVTLRLICKVYIQKQKVFDISILQSTGLDRLPSRERGTPEETSPPVAAEGKGR